MEILDKDGVAVYKNKKREFDIVFSKEDIKKMANNKQVFKSYGNLRIIVYPFDFYGRLNILILGNDISHLNRILKNTIFMFFIFMILIFGISVFSSILIMNKILDAIKKINDTAKIVERDTLKHRIETVYNTHEIDELIKTLNDMFDRIEKGFDKISQFSSDVSHELKTPMASIKSMIEVELVEQRSVEEYKEVMIKILEEIDWLTNIINDLLLMTRIEAGKENVTLSNVDIKELIEDVLELISMYANENNVDIIFETKKSLLLKCDKNKIKRLLLNLISNAIKYNVENGKVYISITENKNEVIIEVKDTGIGIKKENIEHVFERFYREDKARTSKKSGSGLGLAIVESIVKLHNGKITIESNEGKGTVIKVIFYLNINED